MTRSEAKAISSTIGKAIQILAGVDLDGDVNFPWRNLDDATRERAHEAHKAVREALHYVLDMASEELGK